MMEDHTPNGLLEDRVILVTGAGQGLGRAAALAYAAKGATVILLGRTVTKLEGVYDEIEAAGGPQPVIFPMDLAAATDPDYEALAQAIAQQLARLDGILHCATHFYNLSPLYLQSGTQWLEFFKTNTLAPFALNTKCEHLLKRSPDASVILVGESHGHLPAAYWGGFAVSKAALEAYFKIQSDEWSDLPNLRINLLIPGAANTPQRARSHPGEFKDTLPQPEEVARQLTYLMGPESRNLRGRILQYGTDLP